MVLSLPQLELWLWELRIEVRVAFLTAIPNNPLVELLLPVLGNTKLLCFGDLSLQGRMFPFKGMMVALLNWKMKHTIWPF